MQKRLLPKLTVRDSENHPYFTLTVRLFLIQHLNLADVQLALSSYRKSLCTMASRTKTDDRTHPSSHTRYSSLNTPEKDERLRRMHRKNARLKSQISQLREKISAAVNNNGVNIDSELNEDTYNGCSREEQR